MVLPGKMSQPDSEAAGVASEMPLLSDDGRSFLDGKIDAAKYVESARRDAAESALRDISRYVPHKRYYRGSIIFILISAAIAYAVLGIFSFASKEGDGFGAIALLTSGAAFAASAFIRFHQRDNEDPGSRSNWSVISSIAIHMQRQKQR